MNKMTMVLSLMVLALGLSAQAKLQVDGPHTGAHLAAPQAGDDQHISEFFGHVQLNMSGWRSWNITNTGDTSLEFLDMRLTGMMYNGSTNCPTVLEPQQVCQIDIRFSPFSEGYHTGYLDVIVNQGGNLYFDFWGYGVR